MTTTTKPNTYSAAAKIAETVTLDEFAEMIANDNTPTIFPAPRKDAHIALFARIAVWNPGFGSVIYDYCKRNGYADCNAVTVGSTNASGAPIFAFDNGRTVKVQPRD
jgi:hypothetical protein